MTVVETRGTMQPSAVAATPWPQPESILPDNLAVVIAEKNRGGARADVLPFMQLHGPDCFAETWCWHSRYSQFERVPRLQGPNTIIQSSAVNKSCPFRSGQHDAPLELRW